MPLPPSASPDSPPPTHWVVPFAASLSAPCQHTLPHLDVPATLPRLSNLLGRLQVVSRLDGDEYQLSMPHERVLAAEMGWEAADGLQPWAAWWAAQDAPGGVALEPDRCWALLSPGHWLMGRDHLTLLDPHSLGLDEATSKALLGALRALFEDDGWTLRWGAATRWYSSHPELDGLPTASLDRVIGRDPDIWLSEDPDGHPLARRLRRLQAEVQMLLYQHPLNDARSEQGLATVNSFWVSGCGRPPRTLTLPAATRVLDELRAPLLGDDMPLWLEAWRHLDATALVDLTRALDAGHPVRLTLCGERHAVTLASTGSSSLGRRLLDGIKQLTARSPRSTPSSFLASL